MNVLIIDHDDALTSDLVQMIALSKASITIRCNEKITIAEASMYDKIIVSHGACMLSKIGVLFEIIEHYRFQKPIFGVCLGMHAIVEVFGGKLVPVEDLEQVVPTAIHHTSSPLFAHIPSQFQAKHYYERAVLPEALPAELKVTATDERGAVMALEHKEFPLCGVQFYPESIVNGFGKELMSNFLSMQHL